jgi:hypothetical protein
MRLARLVAAGLVLGAVTGFAMALFRPRSVPSLSHPGHPVPGSRREPVGAGIGSPGTAAAARPGTGGSSTGSAA